jgi:ABC-type multidrug transport system ATPase subunit
LVIASIHQPSTATFGLFDKLMLLSRGKCVYNGEVEGVKEWFEGLGYEVSLHPVVLRRRRELIRSPKDAVIHQSSRVCYRPDQH